MCLQVSGPVRHVAREYIDPDFDYCVAFYNRRTRQTTYRPVSLLRVHAQVTRPGEKLDTLDDRRHVASFNRTSKLLIVCFRRSQVTNYSLNKSLTLEEAREQSRILTDQFGNARKRKALEEQQRRIIDDKSMEAMTSATMDSTFDASTNSIDNKSQSFSMLTDVCHLDLIKAQNWLQPDSEILPKLNKTAKTAEDVFKSEDFFTTPTQLEKYKKQAVEWFGVNKNAEAFAEAG